MLSRLGSARPSNEPDGTRASRAPSGQCRFASTEVAYAPVYHRIGDCHATRISLRASWEIGIRASPRDERDGRSTADGQVPELETHVVAARKRAAPVGREHN